MTPRAGTEDRFGVFTGLGRAAAARPWFFLAAWAIILAFGAIGARKAPAVLFSGSGDIPGSPSLSADSLMRADFANPYSQLLVLAVRGSTGDSALAARLDKVLSRLPEVGAVMGPDNILDKRLLPEPGTGLMILIGVKAANVRDAEQALPAVRKAVDALLGEAKRSMPALEWAVTGRSAVTYDLNLFSARDTAEAEVRVIPLTLLILLFAFGSVVAAGLPVAMGVISTTVSMGAVYLMASRWEMSNLVQNVASMIGLAVGIDYSLLIVHRYREALKERAAGEGREARAAAIVEAMGTAGRAVFFSGLAVMIGLGGMLFAPCMEPKSIGWGGCLVVLVSVAAALTFLPALLMVLGPALDWPRSISRRFGGGESGKRWGALSRWIMKRAPWCAAAGLAVVAVMSWPGLQTRFGFPEGPFLPAELEFNRGWAMLDKMGMRGLVRPLNVIVTAGDGAPALTTGRIDALYAFSARIRSDSSVARILGPIDLSDHWPLAKYRNYYEDIDLALEQAPFIADFFLSRDRKSLLMQVILSEAAGLEEEKRLAREIPSWIHVPNCAVAVGGQGVYYNDFDKAMTASYGPSLAFVFAVTCIALLGFFRSPIVSIKALIMNVLSVLAGYGAVVWVFQLGHLHWLFGTPGPSHVVPLTIPLMLFCLLFGLSMDYEVFLLSRIREGWLRGKDNETSVAEGLAATGPIITSAALIMAAVFGAFAFAKVVIVQMLGLGLAVAVIVDATLIRVVLVPAFMKLFGRWNWWPNHRIPKI